MNKQNKSADPKLLNNLFSLDGKTAIVTGAARGIGFEIANGFLVAGAIVYFIDVIDSEFFKKSENAFFIKADIGKKEDLERIITEIRNSGRTVDILVNNAGVANPFPSEEYPIEEWEKTLAIDLTAHFFLSQLVAREMIESNKGGSIINITSMSGKFGFSNNPSYAAAKGGLTSLTRALAKDWAKYNIRVNSISPGYIRTDMTKKSYSDSFARAKRLERALIKRYGEPKDFVGVSIFLASDASNYITGAEIILDGGWSVSGF